MNIIMLKSEIYQMLDNLDEQQLQMVSDLVTEHLKKNDLKPGRKPDRVTDWQLKRKDESRLQAAKGKYFSNKKAEKLLEKWVLE